MEIPVSCARDVSVLKSAHPIEQPGPKQAWGFSAQCLVGNQLSLHVMRAKVSVVETFVK